jgi:mono/diheme cytochrome c family protein
LQLRTLLLTGLIAFRLGGGATGAAAEELEPGTGSDVVMRDCSKCHAIDNILQVRKNRADWDTTVHLMRNYGMDMSDQDMQIVIDYLSAYYGFEPRKRAAK